MFGRPFAPLYASPTAAVPSTAANATVRRNPVARLATVATATTPVVRAIPPPDSVIRPWCRKSAAAGRDYASSPPRASSMPDSTSSNIVASGASVRPVAGKV
ncbi:hypothetical protein RE0356_30060 [Prescottella equi]|nr:hypothetical protein RE0356_30060 [Prescottella equi]